MGLVFVGVESNFDSIPYANSLEGFLKGTWEHKKFAILNKELKCEWTEGIRFNDKTIRGNQEIVSLLNVEKMAAESMFNMFSNIVGYTQKMALCKMEDPLGHGVFATEDIPFCWLLYAGELLVGYPKDHGALSQNGCFHVINSKDKKPKKDCIIDGGKFKNIANFIQHAPDLDDLDKYWFENEQDRGQIATSNTEIRGVQFGDVPMLFFAGENLKAKEQLLKNYGLEYWFALGKSPELFTKDVKVYTGNYLGPIRIDVDLGGGFIVKQTWSGKERKTLLDKIKTSNSSSIDVNIKAGKMIFDRAQLLDLLQDKKQCVYHLENKFFQADQQKLAAMLFTSGKTPGLELREAAANAKITEEEFDDILRKTNMINPKIINEPGPTSGKTALYFAVERNNIVPIMKLLAQENIDLALKTKGEPGDTPYTLAVKLGKLPNEIIEKLRPPGVEPLLVNKAQSTTSSLEKRG